MKTLKVLAAAFSVALNFGVAQAATVVSDFGVDPITLSSTEYNRQDVDIGNTGFSINLTTGPYAEPFEAAPGVFQYDFAQVMGNLEKVRDTGDIRHSVEFSAGASIGDNVEISASSDYEWTNRLEFFNPLTGLLPNVGSTARVAIRLTTEEYDRGPATEVCGTRGCRLFYRDSSFEELSVGYGFLDFERGSFILNGFTANPTGSVTTPAAASVPLPAGLPLLLAGLGGLGLLSRRHRAV